MNRNVKGDGEQYVAYNVTAHHVVELLFIFSFELLPNNGKVRRRHASADVIHRRKKNRPIHPLAPFLPFGRFVIDG